MHCSKCEIVNYDTMLCQGGHILCRLCNTVPTGKCPLCGSSISRKYFGKYNDYLKYLEKCHHNSFYEREPDPIGIPWMNPNFDDSCTNSLILEEKQLQNIHTMGASQNMSTKVKLSDYTTLQDYLSEYKNNPNYSSDLFELDFENYTKKKGSPFVLPKSSSFMKKQKTHQENLSVDTNILNAEVESGETVKRLHTTAKGFSDTDTDFGSTRTSLSSKITIDGIPGKNDLLSNGELSLFCRTPERRSCADYIEMLQAMIRNPHGEIEQRFMQDLCKVLSNLDGIPKRDASVQAKDSDCSDLIATRDHLRDAETITDLYLLPSGSFDYLQGLNKNGKIYRNKRKGILVSRELKKTDFCGLAVKKVIEVQAEHPVAIRNTVKEASTVSVKQKSSSELVSSPPKVGVVMMPRISREPFPCPITSCTQSVFVSDFIDHYKIDHQYILLQTISPGNVRNVFLDPYILGGAETKCVSVFLATDKVQNLGTGQYKDFLPILLLASMVKFPKSVDCKDFVAENNLHCMMVWLTGLVPDNLTIHCNLTASCRRNSNSDYRLSHTGLLYNIRNSQDPFKVFQTGHCIYIFKNQIENILKGNLLEIQVSIK